MKLSAKQRVANGVEFLNQTCPNWKEKIDVSRLDLSDADNCIMGQIGWPKREQITAFSAVQHSVIAELCGFLQTDHDVSYKALQKEWLKVLS